MLLDQNLTVVEEQISKELEGVFENHTAWEFELYHLLEAEAVASLYLYILEIKGSKEQIDIANDNAFLWEINRMSSQYSSLIFFMIDNLLQWTGKQSPREKEVKFACGILLSIIDIAIAHPSESFIEDLGANKLDFHPTLKFVRLVKSFFTLDESDLKKLAEKPHNKKLFESTLLKNIEFQYPDSLTIYLDWSKYLQSELEKDDHGITQARLRATACRLDDKVHSTRSILIENINSIPVIYSDNKGDLVFYFSNSLLDRTLRDRLMVDIFNDLALKEAERYFLNNKPFKCPGAKLGICKDRKSICFTGIEKDSDFPDKSICKIRMDLNSLSIPGFK